MDDNKQNMTPFGESNMYGEQMLEVLPFGVLAYTVPDMKLLCANRELYRLFEIDTDVEKVDVEKNIMRKVLREDAPIIGEMETALVNVGDETSYVFRIKRKNGDVIYIECVARLLAFEDGTRYVASSLSNITTRAEFSNKLYLERQQFREALVRDAVYCYKVDVTDGVLIKDDTLVQSAFMLEKRGLDVPKDFDEASRIYIEQADVEFADEDAKDCFSRAGLLRLYNQDLGGREMKFYERADGVHIKMQLFFLADKTSGHLTCTCVCTDATKEHEEEQEKAKLLKEKQELSETMLQEKVEAHKTNAILQMLGDEYTSVYYIDLDSNTGKAFRLSELHHERLCINIGEEFSFTEMYNTYLDRFVVEMDKNEMEIFSDPEAIDRLLKDRDVIARLYRVLGRQGEVYARIRIARVPDERENSVVIGFVNADKEIREEKEREKILQDALTRAEYANKAKSTFLNSMSHNIRVPMNSIIGYTTIAAAHVDDRERLLDCLEKIQVSGTHMLSLIDDVLDMSRIEAGKLEIIEEETGLSRVVHDIKNFVLADIRAKQLELVFDAVDIRDEYVWCDKIRLNQAIYNCIGNAIKFTPAGGMVSVKVTQVPCDKDGYATYEFKIQDTGIGIGADFIEHVFEPFERENTPNVNNIPGTGLGLSISKNIVDRMDGTIVVESEKGKGTEVTVSFTFRLVSGKEQSMTVPQLEDMRALVVDSNLDTCTSIVDMLKRMGLRTEQAVYGREAVSKIKKSVQAKDMFGVYIVDSLMPDISVQEVVRCIHEELSEDSPIVVLTAYDWEDIEDHADEYNGVTAFCTKPLFFSDLCTTLEKAAKKPEDKDSKEMKYIDDMKFLLVEDNEMNLEITHEVLTENGAVVDVARNGVEAVQMMEKSPGGYYDAVLMDIQMPLMDGYEATRKIRAIGDDYHATVPIIAFSANVFEDDKQTAIESGMNAHISKPIRVDVLLKTINEIMHKDKHTDEHPSSATENEN